MDKLMVGLSLVALGLLLGLVTVTPIDEFGYSDRVCLINESPTEGWPYGSSLEIEALVVPGRSPGGASPVIITQSEDTIRVSVSEYPGDLYWMVVSPRGRFSDMEIICPNEESF
jgi:hypothetical protein